MTEMARWLKKPCEFCGEEGLASRSEAVPIDTRYICSECQIHQEYEKIIQSLEDKITCLEKKEKKSMEEDKYWYVWTDAMHESNTMIEISGRCFTTRAEALEDALIKAEGDPILIWKVIGPPARLELWYVKENEAGL